MLTITKIQSDSIGKEATDKLLKLTYKRFVQECFGQEDFQLNRKIEDALLYVFALSEWTPSFDFYVEGTQTNCLTQSIILNIKNKINGL